MFALIFAFVIPISSDSIINIDLGSQYLKFGQTDTEKGYFVVRKIYNKNIVPGLISIITPKDLPLPLTSEKIEKIAIKSSEQTGSFHYRKKQNVISVVTGWRGIQQIHRFPTTGAEYIINSAIKRESPCDSLNTSSLLDVFMINVLQDMPESLGVKKFSLAFPTFFTPAMKRLITEPLKKIPNFEIVEEFTTLKALSTLYANRYINRYRKSKHGRNVLFIDVGFQYVETLFVNFEWQGSLSVANCLSNMWSENCSTRAFAEHASKVLHIPFSHTERILKSSYNESIFSLDLVNSLKKLVNDTIIASKQPVDEVQLLGGGSSYYFIQSIITSVVNGSFRMNATRYDADKTRLYLNVQNQIKLVGPEKKIYPLDVSSKESTFDKDLQKTLLNSSQIKSDIVNTEIGQFDGVLIGSMYSTLYNSNNHNTNNNPIKIKKEKPSSSYYITVGGKRVIYCEKNSWCQPEPSLQSVTGGPNYTVDIESLESDIPKGSSIVANRYYLENLEKFESENGDKIKEENSGFTAYFSMKTPDPFINEAKWCTGPENCTPISLKMKSGDDLTNEIISNENYDLVNIFYTQLSESKAHEQFNKNLKRAFDRMKMMCSKSDKPACNQFQEIQKKHDNGEYEAMPISQLEEEIVPKINSLCKSFGFRFD